MVERGLRAAGLRTGRYTSPHLDRDRGTHRPGWRADRCRDLRAGDRRRVRRGRREPAVGRVEGHADLLRGLDRGRVRDLPAREQSTSPSSRSAWAGASMRPTSSRPTLPPLRRLRSITSVTSATRCRRSPSKKRASPRPACHWSSAGCPRRPPSESPRSRREVGAPVLDAHADHDRPHLSAAEARAARAAISSRTRRSRWRSSSDGPSCVSEVPTAAIVTGLTQCEWPARLEWLRLPSGAELLIDAAHNPAGAAALSTYLEDNGLSPLPIVIVDHGGQGRHGHGDAAAPVASSFIATTVPHARARTAEALADDHPRRSCRDIPVVAEPSPDAAVVTATAGARACGGGRLDLPDRAAARAPPRCGRQAVGLSVSGTRGPAWYSRREPVPAFCGPDAISTRTISPGGPDGGSRGASRCADRAGLEHASSSRSSGSTPIGSA